MATFGFHYVVLCCSIYLFKMLLSWFILQEVQINILLLRRFKWYWSASDLRCEMKNDTKFQNYTSRTSFITSLAFIKYDLNKTQLKKVRSLFDYSVTWWVSDSGVSQLARVVHWHKVERETLRIPQAQQAARDLWWNHPWENHVVSFQHHIRNPCWDDCPKTSVHCIFKDKWISLDRPTDIDTEQEKKVRVHRDIFV